MHVFITGASSGIGAAVADAFAAAGHDLTLVSRRPARVSPGGGRVREVAFDIGEIDALPALVDEAAAALGEIDVLVNNAGVSMVEHTNRATSEAALRLLRVNLLAPLELTRLVVGGMKRRGRGTIVDVASVNAFAPTPYSYHYNAAKAGLAAASESLRGELRSYGVHVLTVYPGPIRTPLLSEASAKMDVSVPAFALGTPEVLARKIVRGVAKRRDRIVYPGLFSVTRMMPNTVRWSLERFYPRLAAPAAG